MKLKICVALLTAATLLAPLSSVAETKPDAAAAKRTAVEAYGRLPLSFEPTASPAHYLARNGSYAVLIGAGESAVAVKDAKSGKQGTLRFAFEKANPAAQLEAMEPQPGVTNYYLGSDPSKWRTGVKSYARLRSAGVYPGVDVVYYGDHRRLEFDYVVAPKADASAIVLGFSGMDKFGKESNGDLVAEVAGQPVRVAKPYAYQKVDGAARPVAADYEVAANGKVHLRLGEYDHARELIVDPAVTYATYLGGTSADVGNGIAVDSTGAAYVTGTTNSPLFPLGGQELISTGDAFVTKFNAAGTGIVYTTVIGGTLPETATASGNAIALDSSNNVYITGRTNATNLPGNVDHANGLNTYQGGDSNAFVVILDPNGANPRSTYLGGSDNSDVGFGIAVDTSKNVIVVGQTCADNFPGYNAFETKIEKCVAFITKMDNALDIGQNPQYGASAMTPLAVSPTSFFSEFFAGQLVAPHPSASWQANFYFPKFAIIEDNEVPPNIQIVTTAGTSGGSIGTPLGAPLNPWNSSLNGITADGGITWTNLGPVVTPVAAASQANGVALDPQGDIFIAGGTTTADLGAIANAEFGPFSSFHGTGAWVLKVSGVDGKWIYGSALETTASNNQANLDTANAIAVDTTGDAYVVGTASGSIFTSAGSYSPAPLGGSDAFVVALRYSSSLDTLYGTYLGGSGADQGLGVAVDESGSAYVTGSTTSTDFPTINPLTEPDGEPILTLQGSQNAFVAKFTPNGSALQFSAYLGGSNSDQGNAIALDTATSGLVNISTAGNMYVAGTTSSSDFEINLDPAGYTAPQTTFGGGASDAFVAQVLGKDIPIVTVAPGSLNFGPQDVNLPSVTPQAVLYTNTNAYSSVVIQSIAFAGAEPGDFMQVFPGTAPGDCSAGVIPAGATCNVWVVFTPAAVGPRTGTLVITDDASSKPHSVFLSGTGEAPAVSLAPTGLIFAAASPYQPIGKPTAVQTVTLTNTGQGILDISNITIGGTNPEDFSGASVCTPQLASGSSCTVNVTFTPSAAGVRTALLTIADNVPGSPTQSVTLQGTGAAVAAPTVAPSNLTLTFPTQALNSASAAQSITITNTDTVSTLVVGLPSATGDFQVAPLNGSCGFLLAPGASCVIGVTFTPTASGIRTGTLSVSTNAPALPLIQVALTGTGAAAVVPSGTITLAFVAPATGSFGNQTVGTTSAAETVTLTNSAAAALSVTGISVLPAGSGNTDFAISGSNCSSTLPFNLAAGASCSIQVTFAPSATGLESASLQVTGASSNSPQSVALSGTGMASGTGGQDFNINPANGSGGVSVTQGSPATYTLQVAPVSGYTGTVSFNVTGLPNGSSWSVSPSPLKLTGATQNITLTVTTSGGRGSSAKAVPPESGSRAIFLALLPFSMMGMLFMNKRRGIWLALGLVLLCLLLGMVGCGSGSGNSSGMAAGTYQFTLVAVSSGGTEVQNIPLTLVVNQQ